MNACLAEAARRRTALFAACVLFFWMFLAAEPLEQAGAFAEAALWRHGMAGNSPLYMPGFFAVAATAWWWARAKRPSRLWIEGSAVVIAACAVAAAFAPLPTLRTVALATYTLATWTVFVACCQRALAKRTWRALWPIPPMTAVLMVLRTWTLDDVREIWVGRLLQADPVALASSAAIPILVFWMLRTELTSSRQRVAVHAPSGPDVRRKSARPLPSEQSP